MVNKYTITVHNNSGDFKKYFLFNEKPEITNVVSDKIWSNVFATANAGPGQTAVFTIYQQYQAIVGSSSGQPSDGITVNVSGSKPVNLGAVEEDGSKIAGSSIFFDVRDEAPYFLDGPAPDAGDVKAFEIKSPEEGSNFTAKDADKGNYLIGIGTSTSGGQLRGPTATFTPSPGTDYQIKPVNKFYVSFGKYQQGDMISIKSVASKIGTADFSSNDAPDDFTFNNDDHNKFVLMKAKA